jgi:hypothetical protein
LLAFPFKRKKHIPVEVQFLINILLLSSYAFLRPPVSPKVEERKPALALEISPAH